MVQSSGHLATERPLVILDFIIKTTHLRRTIPQDRAETELEREMLLCNIEKGEGRKIPL